MDIRDYRYFLAIADFNSISKAAKHLYITQSALTKYLQRLEKEVGTALFFRQGKMFNLTQAGNAYLEKARQIDELDIALDDEIKQIIADTNTHIRLGYAMGWADCIFADVLPDFYVNYPDVCVTALFDAMSEQLKQLELRKLDLAFGSSNHKNPQYNYIILGKALFTLIVHKDSELLSKSYKVDGYPYPVVDKESWINESFISVSPTTNSGRIMHELLKKGNINPKTRLQVHDVKSCISAVENKIGLSMLWSAHVFSPNIKKLCLKEFGMLEQELYVVTRKDFVLTPAVKYLIERLRKIFEHNISN